MLQRKNVQTRNVRRRPLVSSNIEFLESRNLLTGDFFANHAMVTVDAPILECDATGCPSNFAVGDQYASLERSGPEAIATGSVDGWGGISSSLMRGTASAIDIDPFFTASAAGQFLYWRDVIFMSGDEAPATIQVSVSVAGKINTPSVEAEVYPQSVGAAIGVSVGSAREGSLEDLNGQTSFCYYCLIQGGTPADGLKVYQNKYPSSDQRVDIDAVLADDGWQYSPPSGEFTGQSSFTLGYSPYYGGYPLMVSSWMGAVVSADGGSASVDLQRLSLSFFTADGQSIAGGFSSDSGFDYGTSSNNAPIASDLVAGGVEDSLITIELEGSDQDGDALSYTIDALPTVGQLFQTPDGVTLGSEITSPGSLVQDSLNRVIYRPPVDLSGYPLASFSYRANDGTESSESATVEIEIDSVNDAPSFVPGPDISILEDSGWQIIESWASEINSGPVDEIQSLEFLVNSDNPQLFSTEPAIDEFGNLTFQTAPDAFGSATVNIQLVDDGGTDQGGDDRSPIHTLFVEVQPVLDAEIRTRPFVNLNSNGNISIVILSEGEVDPTRLNPMSIAFDSARPVDFLFSDVNGDGELDLSLIYALEETELMETYRSLLEDDLEDGTLDSTTQTTQVEITGLSQDGTLLSGTTDLELSLRGRALRELLGEL